MQVVNNFLFTLSTFTKIPTPNIEYNEKNTKYVFFYLPLVGLVLGVINLIAFNILNSLLSETIIIAIIMIFINLNITGGIHMDGYIDSMDAFKSYRSYGEKKRIIKDPTVGAFGLIHFVAILLLYFIVYFYLIKYDYGIIFLLMPIVSRLIILSLVCNNKRESNDMLDDLISSTIENKYLIVVVIYTIIIFILSYIFSWENSAVIVISLFAGAILYAVYFNFMFKRHFKEMNGDLCGYYIVMSEVVAPMLFLVTSFILLKLW